MKVKCRIATYSYSEKEVEIDDKFKTLVVNRPQEHNIPLTLYDEAIAAVETATGVKMDDSGDGEFILNVRDSETDTCILEL